MTATVVSGSAHTRQRASQHFENKSSVLPLSDLECCILLKHLNTNTLHPDIRGTTPVLKLTLCFAEEGLKGG